VGLRVGDPVEFTGELLSVQLGPGLLTQIYDGLQNPLPELAEKYGFSSRAVWFSMHWMTRENGILLAR